MTAAELIQRFDMMGIKLEADGDGLIVDAPEGLLDAQLLDEIASHKSAILALLQGAADDSSVFVESETAWRLMAMQRQMPACPPYPVFVARQDIEVAKGNCLSCGDALNGQKRFLCFYCSRAKARLFECL